VPEPKHVLTIIAVENLASAVAFYTKVLGWRRSVDVPVYAELEGPGGMRLGLYDRKGFGRNIGRPPARIAHGDIAPTELYFHVDDLEAAMGRMKDVAAEVLSPLAPREWGDEAAYFADPDGNVIVLARPLTRD
jgi:catechol 2,3-dioxygenase-like lactoylglutathione lyase family enzyme